MNRIIAASVLKLEAAEEKETQCGLEVERLLKRERENMPACDVCGHRGSSVKSVLYSHVVNLCATCREEGEK